ncbi:MAG: rsgA, partial [Paenibacillaceae bacterium]|nr:rsgA [Paenibacillaceae bacterium]
MDLKKIGWNVELERAFEPFREQGFTLARVIVEHKDSFRVMAESGEMLAEVSGKMRFQAATREGIPAVGDWVAIRETASHDYAVIQAILPRKSKFSRKVAGGTTDEQIVATNVDTVLLVNSLNQDFNINRLERYLITAWESGANPVVVLSKADQCEADVIERKVKRVGAIAPSVPIHVLSAVTMEGFDSLAPYLGEGQTVALVGSSGVGKSTIINILIGEDVQKVTEIRLKDDRGRHTTTHRELFMLPSGGVIIDTPGMRELHLWSANSGMAKAFDDIEQLAAQCFFNDCQHRKEPRCAVQLAIQEGRLSPNRLANYRNLGGELAALSERAARDYREVKEEKGKKAARRLIDKERGRKSFKYHKSRTK